MTSSIETDLAPVGKHLQKLAKASKKTMRQIATDTKLSVNSVKVVFTGAPGNVKTYDTVARYLGTSFVRAVVDSISVPNGCGMETASTGTAITTSVQATTEIDD